MTLENEKENKKKEKNPPVCETEMPKRRSSRRKNWDLKGNKLERSENEKRK